MTGRDPHGRTLPTRPTQAHDDARALVAAHASVASTRAVLVGVPDVARVVWVAPVDEDGRRRGVEIGEG